MNLFLILFFFSSCDKTYKVYSERIKSSDPIKNGFLLKQIAVTAFEKGGTPSEYSISKTIFCGPNPMLSDFLADTAYSEIEKKVLSDAWKTMDSIFKINDGRIGGQGHDNGGDLFVSSKHKRDSIKELHFPFTAQKIIYFHKPNEYYKWVFCTNQADFENAFDYSKGVFDEMPIQFNIDQWYMFDFSDASNIIDKVFFYIDKKRKIHQYNNYKVLIGV